MRCTMGLMVCSKHVQVGDQVRGVIRDNTIGFDGESLIGDLDEKAKEKEDKTIYFKFG